MKKRALSNLAMSFMAAVLCFGAAGARAGVRKDLDELKHALGWDTMDMKTTAMDREGRPTTEVGNTVVNLVERRTTYFANGGKDTQVVTVVSRRSGKTLYRSTKAWDASGDVRSLDVEDDTFRAGGRQWKGQNSAMTYKHGRLVDELVRRYSDSDGRWADLRRDTITYYGDGDMKERITEYLPSGEKDRERWGVKNGVLGRKETDDTWNQARGVWD